MGVTDETFVSGGTTVKYVEWRYGVKLDIPEGSKITHVKGSPSAGYTVTYIPPTQKGLKLPSQQVKPTPPPVGEMGTRPTPASRRQAWIEHQIKQTYMEAPIVEKPAPVGTKKTVPPFATGTIQVYEPTPEQAEKIVGLVEQLPEEKKAKYITYAPVKEEPKGVAEWLMMEVSPAFRYTVASGIGGLMGYGKEEREALAGWISSDAYKVLPASVRHDPIGLIAAPIASVESAVYGGERLISTFVTHHKPVTPRPPPGYISGVIGTALGDPTELQQTMEYGREYAAGTILGDILVGFAIGKGAEKAWSGLKRVPVIRKGPLFLERAKHSVVEAIVKKAPERLQKWYYGPSYKEWKMSQELLWEKKPFAGYKEFYLTTETMLPTKPPAEQWLLKMKGVRTTPFSKTLELAITKGGGLGGLAATQQLVVTKYAKRVPFDLIHYPITGPSTKLATGGLTRTLFGFSVATGLKTFEATAKRERTTLKVVAPQRLFPIVEHITKVQPIQKHKQVLRIWQIQETPQKQKQILRTQQVQIQQQIQIQKQFFDSKLFQKPMRVKLPRFRVPEVLGRRKREPLFGAWFKRTHPIKSPEAMARTFFGEPRKKKRKKGKRRKPLRFTL